MQRLRAVWWTWREIGVESSLVQYVCFTDFGIVGSECLVKHYVDRRCEQANVYLMPLSRLYCLDLVPCFQT